MYDFGVGLISHQPGFEGKSDFFFQRHHDFCSGAALARHDGSNTSPTAPDTVTTRMEIVAGDTPTYLILLASRFSRLLVKRNTQTMKTFCEHCYMSQVD